MELRSALKEQYHAGLAMFRQCIERCPNDRWVNPSGDARAFWRIAFHNAYFTHLYLGQGESAFGRPPKELTVGRREEFEAMWQAPFDLEPYELPPDTVALSQSELADYVVFIDGLIDPTVDDLDLDTANSGFSWYKGIGKTSHQLLNLRQLQGHVGQLSELLMLRGIDIDWVSKSKPGS